MRKELIIGVLLVLVGFGLFAYYNNYIKPEEAGRELLTEGKLTFERGNREAINNSINTFSKVIAKYPDTKAAVDAYYYIGKGYEKLGLNRLAYLKYVYILKNDENLSSKLYNEVRARLAGISIKRNYTEEGINQLLGMLNYSRNPDLRSRIYTELGHTYLKVGKYKKSKRMFDIALHENGNNEEAILGKARAYKRLGHSTKAYNMYDYFLKYYGDYSHFSDDIQKSYHDQLYSSAYNSYKRGSYYQSIKFFRKFLQSFPYSQKTENGYYWLGENYFALKKYNTALKYFNKTLSNSIYGKDQDARIKKGYSYFLTKRYEFAAREFQIYLDKYPNGKFTRIAKKWRDMSEKEILYRKNLSKEKETSIDDEDLENDYKIENNSESVNEKKKKNDSTPKGVKHNNSQDKYENVAEI